MITIISVLGFVALNRYYKLLVDVERTSMEHDLGVMRSAISMQVADYFVSDRMAELPELIHSNPMDLLAGKPNNYLGEMVRYRIEDIEKGNWFFDSRNGILIYTVNNQLYFETQLDEPFRARFQIEPVYSSRAGEGETGRYLSGLVLQALEPYRWLRPWD